MHSSSPTVSSTPVSPAKKWIHTKIQFANSAGNGTIDEDDRDEKIKPLLHALTDSYPKLYPHPPIVSDISFEASCEPETNPDLPWRYLSLLETRLRTKKIISGRCTSEIISAACYLIADILATTDTKYSTSDEQSQHTTYTLLLKEHLNNTSIEDANLQNLRQFFEEKFPILNTLLERNSPLTTLGEYAAVFLYAAIVTDPAVLVAEAEQLRQHPERLATLRTLVTTRLSNNVSELRSAFAEAEKKGVSPTLKQLKQQIIPPQAATSLEQALAAAAAAAAASPLHSTDDEGVAEPPQLNRVPTLTRGQHQVPNLSITGSRTPTELFTARKRRRAQAPRMAGSDADNPHALKARKTGPEQAATGEPVSSDQQEVNVETSTTAPRPDTPRPGH